MLTLDKMNLPLPNLRSWAGLSIHTKLGLAIVLIGLILRLRPYLANRSLWLDEAMLAVNIVNRSYLELTRWLDYDQQAPIGFLWLQKTAVLLFGDHEFALRLVPFLAGCLALVLMYRLTRLLPPPSDNAALAFFALSDTLIYYTSEAKQYIVDVLVALGLLWAFLPVLRRSTTDLPWRDLIWPALLGALAIWFSHPAVFTLSALGLIWLAQALAHPSRPTLLQSLAVGGLWLTSFGFFYLLFLHRSVTADVLTDYWDEAFLPLSARLRPWLLQTAQALFPFTLGLDLPPWLGLLLILAGGACLVRRDRALAALLILPILLSLVASALRAYPFAGRMLLFTAPAMLILLGEGTYVPGLLLRRSPAASFWTSSLLAVALIAFHTPSAVQAFLAPKMSEHIRPALAYLRDHRRPGDRIYIYYWAEPAVRYYAPKFGFQMADFILGNDHHRRPEAYHVELNALRGHPRVWFLFSHVYEQGDYNERKYFLDYLNQIGKRRLQARFPGTSVYLYLYDLR